MKKLLENGLLMRHNEKDEIKIKLIHSSKILIEILESREVHTHYEISSRISQQSLQRKYLKPSNLGGASKPFKEIN